MTASVEEIAAVRPVLLPVPAKARSLDDGERIRRACAALTAGRPVLLTGVDAGPGHLVAAAESMTPAVMAFIVRYSSGFVCVALPDDRAEALDLPVLPRRFGDASTPAYGVSVDAADGVTTGISATDRARTARLLAAPSTTADAFTRPGHMITLRSADGGTLGEPGRAEAATDLLRIAGLHPVAVLCDLVLDPSTPDDVRRHRNPMVDFLRAHRIDTVSVAELIRFRTRAEPQVQRVAAARIPVTHGEFTAVGYRSTVGDAEHVAFVHGGLETHRDDVAVHIHRESVIGDVFGGPDSTLSLKLAETAAERGVLVYLRSADGSPAGIVGTLQQLFATENGAQTLPTEAYPERLIDIVLQILGDLGLRSLRLLTDEEPLHIALTANGLSITGDSVTPRYTIEAP